MSDSQPVTAIRTTLETGQILERLRRAIPRSVTGATTPGVVGGHVDGSRFELLWSDADGRRYKASGLVQQGTSDRLVTIRFRQNWGNGFLVFAMGAMIVLPLDAMGAFTLPVSVLVIGMLALASIAGVMARFTPPSVADAMTEWLRSRLQPGRPLAR